MRAGARTLPEVLSGLRERGELHCHAPRQTGGLTPDFAACGPWLAGFQFVLCCVAEDLLCCLSLSVPPGGTRLVVVFAQKGADVTLVVLLC